jgi:hypothetical protein
VRDRRSVIDDENASVMTHGGSSSRTGECARVMTARC